MTIDDLAIMIQRGIVGVMATKEDLKGFATKEDLKGFATKEDLNAMEQRMVNRFDNLRSEMATKTDIFNLEQKLIEDTGAITGVEQKHHRSHAQRIARLEKTVFSGAV